MTSVSRFLRQRWQLVTTILSLAIGVAGLVIGVVSILPDPQPDPCIQIIADVNAVGGELQTHARVVSALRSRMEIKDDTFRNAQRRRNRIVGALRAHDVRQDVLRVIAILRRVDDAFRERFEGYDRIYDIHDSAQVEFFAQLLSDAAYPEYQERLALRQSMVDIGFDVNGIGIFVAGGRLFDTSVRDGLIEGFQVGIAMHTDNEETLWDLGYDPADLRSGSGEEEAASLRRAMDDIRADYRELASQLTPATALENDAAIRLQALEEQMQQHGCSATGGQGLGAT